MENQGLSSQRSAITGQCSTHVTLWRQPFSHSDTQIHHAVHQPLNQLVSAAKEKGISLCVASGFRSFDRQLAIWNAKARGRRAVLDSNGHALDMSRLSPKQQVFAILRWSALPGASRHHWGTDVDIWDSAAVPEGYQLQLTPEEYCQQGVFSKLYAWLNTGVLATFDFNRPYAHDNGGIAPEPWHLSYQPQASIFAQGLQPQHLATVLAASDILLKQTIIDNIDVIFERFILV